MAGLIRWVRTPLPWRPSKLRFDVDAMRSPGLAQVAVHAHAHRAARLAPLEAGRREDPVEPLGLGGALDQARARHHEGGDHRAATLRDRGRRAQVLEPAVRARADEDAVHPHLATAASRARAPCTRASAPRSPGARGRRRAAGSGTRSVMASASCGLVPHVTVGAISLAARLTSRSKAAPGSEGSVRQYASAWPQRSPAGRVGPPLEVRVRRLVGRDHAGARARLDRHVADRHALVHGHAGERRARVLDRVARRRPPRRSAR